MNNLTQTQKDTKQAYLDNQANQMLTTYHKRQPKRKKRRDQAHRFVSGDRAERCKNLLV